MTALMPIARLLIFDVCLWQWNETEGVLTVGVGGSSSQSYHSYYHYSMNKRIAISLVPTIVQVNSRQLSDTLDKL